MAFEKFYSLIGWLDRRYPGIRAENLNKMDSAINELDDRIVELDGRKTEVTVTNNLLATVAGTALDAVQGKVLDDKITAVNESLTANETQLYMDYQNGRYGYNTDPERGADTFSPFSNVQDLYSALQYSGLVTEDMTFEEICAVLANEYPQCRWLYNYGDTCDDVTGGWTMPTILETTAVTGYNYYLDVNVGSYATISRTFEEDHMRLYLKQPNAVGYAAVGSMYTAGMIDVTNFSTIEIVANLTGTNAQGKDLYVGLYTVEPSGIKYNHSSRAAIFNLEPDDAGTVTYTCDISGLAGEYYINLYKRLYQELADEGEALIYSVRLLP